MPLQIVIDDVGWWSGHDGHEHNEPYRTGIERNHVPEDYEAIALLGRRLGMRPQAAMILCEWDVNDSLRSLPGAQWMGTAWHNLWPRQPMEHAADILRRNAEHVELTLHGIGHEYWPHPDPFRRAELFDGDTNTHRPREHVRGVLDAFARIMQAHDLGSLPTSFVPCAFHYAFDSQLTEMLRNFGIRHTSTVFRQMHNREAVQDDLFGVEQGLITLERGMSAPRWYALDVDPAALAGFDIPGPGPILGLHWPNILHLDPARHSETIDHWVQFIEPYGHKPERMLAPDTARGWTQLIYHRMTRIEPVTEGWSLDFSRVDQLRTDALGNELTIKVQAPPEARFTSNGMTIHTQIYDAAGDCHVLRCRRKSGICEVLFRSTCLDAGPR